MLDALMAGRAPPRAEVLIAPEGVVRRQSTDPVRCQCIRLWRFRCARLLTSLVQGKLFVQSSDQLSDASFRKPLRANFSRLLKPL